MCDCFPFVSFAVLGEIEERRQFLADMASLGQAKKYVNIINTEISQVNERNLPIAIEFHDWILMVTLDEKVWKKIQLTND